MSVFLIVHHPNSPCGFSGAESVWSSREKAEQELDRLRLEGVGARLMIEEEEVDPE